MRNILFLFLFFISGSVFATNYRDVIKPSFCSMIFAKLVNFKKTSATGFLIAYDVPENERFDFLNEGSNAVDQEEQPYNFVGQTGYVSLWVAYNRASLYENEYGVRSFAKFYARYYGSIVNQTPNGVTLKIKNGELLDFYPKFDHTSKRTDVWTALVEASRGNQGWDGDVVTMSAYQGKILTFLPDK